MCKSFCVTFSYVQTDITTPNIVGPTYCVRLHLATGFKLCATNPGQTDEACNIQQCLARCFTLLRVVGSCCTNFETHKETCIYVQTDATTSNVAGRCCVRLHIASVSPIITDLVWISLVLNNLNKKAKDKVIHILLSACYIYVNSWHDKKPKWNALPTNISRAKVNFSTKWHMKWEGKSNQLSSAGRGLETAWMGDQPGISRRENFCFPLLLSSFSCFIVLLDLI